MLEVARDADVLVHEATFSEEERDRADETLHATATSAAELAAAAGVRLLALTHLSNRYFGPEIVREARAIFAETVVPKDFDIIDVRFPERGGPRLVKGGALGRQEEGEPHDRDGSGDRGQRPRGSGGDSDDPPLGRDPVGARVGRGDSTRRRSLTRRRRCSFPKASLEAAQHAIEAMTDPDELIGGR